MVLSLFCIYGHSSSCKKSKKSDERLLRKMSYRRTGGRTDGQTDGEALFYRTPFGKTGGAIKAKVI